MRTRLGVLLGCLLLTAACGTGDAEPDEAASSTTPDASPSGAPTPSTSGATPLPPSSATDPPPATSSGPATRPPAATGTRIVVDDSQFGPMLFDESGQAIYLFDVEKTAKPQCFGECAKAWPPVHTTGEPVAGKGVDESLLGTTERPDGRLQVTYDDHPLYFYVNEGKHEVLCHDVFLNGGKWYVVQPDGSAAPPG